MTTPTPETVLALARALSLREGRGRANVHFRSYLYFGTRYDPKTQRDEPEYEERAEVSIFLDDRRGLTDEQQAEALRDLMARYDAAPTTRATGDSCEGTVDGVVVSMFAPKSVFALVAATAFAMAPSAVNVVVPTHGATKKRATARRKAVIA